MAAVSVLLPCYNARDTLPEALDSLTEQTFQDFEVVVVDDGSTDNTQEILMKYCKKDSRFRTITQDHFGIIPALNNGLVACRAPLIARMDADDRSHPERLSRQITFLNQNPNIALVGCLVRAYPINHVREGFNIYLDWLNRLVSHEEICREIFIESPFPHPSVLFRKEDVLKVGGYQDRGWAEDYDLWFRMYLAGARFAKIPQFLLYWREHTSRLTRVDSRYSLENFLRAKAWYLTQGPLKGRDGIIIWGAGMMGRRLSKHLLRQQVPLVAFVDIDPRKIGNTRRNRPIISPKELPRFWGKFQRPIILAAVGARGARNLIRERLGSLGLVEGDDWLCVA